MTRALVTGGRDYPVAAALPLLDAVVRQYQVQELCQGGASGADQAAREYAAQRGWEPNTFRADWLAPCRASCAPGHRRRHGAKTYCPAAGVYRNQQMLDEFGPDLVFAFPGHNGTADMIARAAAAGLPIVTVGGEQ